MKIKISNRHSLSAAILIFYLLPLLFFATYSIHLMSHNKSWTILSLGLLLISGSCLLLMLLLVQWEETILKNKESHSLSTLPPLSSLSLSPSTKEDKVTSLEVNLPIPLESIYQQPADYQEMKDTSKEYNLLQTTLKRNQEQQEEIANTLEMKIEELHKKEEENKQLEIKAQQIVQDFSDYKLFSEEQLKQKNMQLSVLQQIIEDQRSEMEKRQEQIHQLDTKVHDLSYEIKTLLYLHDEEEGGGAAKSIPIAREEVPRNSMSFENPIQTHMQANERLKKCIGIAQQLTGSHYYSNESSRYREFSSSYYAIDQRRLFDSLRSESSGAMVIVYSQKEDKVLFVNNECKTVLGWNPEKFVIGFPSIIHEGMNEWKKALHSLTTSSESQARLLTKTAQGQEILLHCHLGMITSGLFRNYIIGVLYSISY